MCRLHSFFKPVGKALVLDFLLVVLSACSLQGSPLSIKARLETLNEPAQNIYLNYPVVRLEVKL
jgi:hypothetical protein